MNVLIGQDKAVDNSVFPLAWLMHANPDAANDASDGYTVKAFMTVAQEQLPDNGEMGACVVDAAANQGVFYLISLVDGAPSGKLLPWNGAAGEALGAESATISVVGLAAPEAAEEEPAEEEAEEDYGEEDAETDDAFQDDWDDAVDDAVDEGTDAVDDAQDSADAAVDDATDAADDAVDGATDSANEAVADAQSAADKAVADAKAQLEAYKKEFEGWTNGKGVSYEWLQPKQAESYAAVRRFNGGDEVALYSVPAKAADGEWAWESAGEATLLGASSLAAGVIAFGVAALSF